jgi:hypothetical protein
VPCSRRADGHAGRGDAGVLLQGGDAEVGQDRAAVIVDRDVAGLDVAVKHAGGVRRPQSVDSLLAEAGCSGDDPRIARSR